MGRSGNRLIALIFLLLLIPALSHAGDEKKSSIVGTFAGQGNKPQTGVVVRLLDSYQLTEVARTTTDKNGQFILDVLPGLYLLSIDSAAMQGMLKRIEVNSDTPTFIDVRPILSEEQLKTSNAWDAFKWTIRMAERNPLRDEVGQVMSEDKPEPDGFLAMLRSFQEANNIEGQISYMNVGAAPASTTLNHQLAQFVVQGELEDEGTWAVNGNILEGSRAGYMASGDVQYRLSGHQLGATVSANDLFVAKYPDLVARQRISRFLQIPETSGYSEGSNSWIASVDLQDRWSFWNNLEVAYGTRFDYYGYLQDAVAYSPRVKLAYHVDPTFQVYGAYYRNTSAPGNYYLQPGDVHPYIHDLAFVPYGNTLQPETTTGYETGFDFAVKDFSFSVAYHFDDVKNKVATVDLSDAPVNEDLQAIRPFVIFNAHDLSSRGIEMHATKQITRSISAVVTYNMTQAVPVYIIEKRVFSERQLFFKNGETLDDFHDFQAGIHADFPRTLTQVNASWKWSSGSPLVFGRQENNSSLSALDVEVTQGLPVRVDEAQFRLLLAIKNLLDSNPMYNSNADFQRALLYGMPRIVAGGVLVQF